MMQPWVEACQGLRAIEAMERWGRILPKISERAWSCWRLDFGFLAFRTVRENKFLCKPPSYGHLFQKPSKLIQFLVLESRVLLSLIPRNMKVALQLDNGVEHGRILRYVREKAYLASKMLLVEIRTFRGDSDKDLEKKKRVRRATEKTSIVLQKHISSWTECYQKCKC